MENASSDRVQFGDFELNLKTGELYPADLQQHGRRVLLQEQPFQVLRMLVERRGEIVARQEIKRELWSDDTVVGFDHSINGIIATLRRELGDSAVDPRYIETVARRGYRLLASTDWLESPSHVQGDEHQGSYNAEEAKFGGLSRRNKSFAAMAVVIILALTTWILWRLNARPTLPAGETVVIAVTNKTSDPVFNEALYVPLGIALEQTPYFNVLAPTKVNAALNALNLSVDPAKITTQTAQQVCLRTKSNMVIASSIEESGNQLRIEVRALDCSSGSTITPVWRDAFSRSEVVHVLGLCVAELRAKLGEPKASVARFNKPLEEATSPSPEALQLLSQGYGKHSAGDLQGAILKYQRAIELDPDLAAGLAALASARAQLGQTASAAADAALAYAWRAHLTDPVRFEVESLYYALVTGELEKTCAVLSQWVQRFPDSFIAHNNLGKCLESLGEQERALAEAHESARLYPSVFSFYTAIFRCILTDRLEEAKATYVETDARKFDGPALRQQRLLLAFLQNDKSAMEEQYKWAVDKPGADYLIMNGGASIKAYQGRYREYRRLEAKATELAARENAVVDVAADALYETEIGHPSQARQIATTANIKVENRDKRLALALALARAGDKAEAEDIAKAVSEAAPLDTLVQNYLVPTIRAAIKLDDNNPAAALVSLRDTKYDLAYPSAFNSLYPAYLRGLAYLQLGEGRPAAAEFQKLIDHPGLVGRNVIGALARLQLARAEKLAGNKPAAQKFYEDFLALWRDADQDLPVYQQAKSEYIEMK